MNCFEEIPAHCRDTRSFAVRIRQHALRMTSRGGSSHIASVLSMADILAVLYGRVLRVNPADPRWPERDRVILSKGHAGAGIYAALAERGFFSLAKLQTHYQDGSDLSGHVSHKGIPGVELSTGSLGHGLAVAVGMALACRADRRLARVIALMSDGEFDEGSNWEAILFAAHHRLANLVAVVDFNGIQSLAPVHETLRLEPFADKWRAFGWRVLDVDGHDHELLAAALECPASDAPTVVIARTTKGKGVSFMENSVLWHYRTARGEEFDRALEELKAGG